MRALLRPCLLLLAAVWRSEVLPAACRAADWDCQVRGRGETEHGDGSLPSGYSYPPGVSAKSASATLHGPRTSCPRSQKLRPLPVTA